MTLPDPYPVEPLEGLVDATFTLPGSKSITNRALVCAALGSGGSILRNALRADDTEAMADSLRRLGVAVAWSGDDIWVGSDGPAATAAATLDARQSGTTARFLLPLLALLETKTRLDGDAQLRARPMAPSFAALRTLGATVVEEGEPGMLPVVIGGPVRGGDVEVSGDESSQFLSGLLLAAPQMPDGLTIRLTSTVVSEPYVEMTAAVMRAFGASVGHDDDVWRVEPGRYRPVGYDVEPDASAASYAFAAAAVTGGRATVPRLGTASLQGDVAFVDVLEQMGATVVRAEHELTVVGPDVLRGVDVDMRAISDTVPTLAAIAAVADGPTTIRGVGFIRDKESDRIAGPVAELRRLGVAAEETDDGMVITPGTVGGGVVETYHDHRMAMAFAILGLRVAGIEIADPGCVAKTFPAFWDLLDDLRGGRLPPAHPADG